MTGAQQGQGIGGADTAHAASRPQAAIGGGAAVGDSAQAEHDLLLQRCTPVRGEG